MTKKTKEEDAPFGSVLLLLVLGVFAFIGFVTVGVTVLDFIDTVHTTKERVDDLEQRVGHIHTFQGFNGNVYWTQEEAGDPIRKHVK